jgi:membrane fusion protein (multidrug efflux system)
VSAAFAQTLRALEAERRNRPLWAIAVSLALLAAWAAWFFLARVVVVETSDTARLEVDAAAHRIAAPVAGRVLSSSLVIGRDVDTGEVLLVIDSEAERRQLAEESARLAAVEPQIAALRRALDAQEAAIAADRGATGVALDEARARRDESEIARRLADDEASRAARLREGGAIADLELLQKKSHAEQREASTLALTLDVDRQQRDQRTRESEARTRVAEMQRDLATLEGDRATTAAAIERLHFEVDRRTVRSPLAGRIGAVGDFRAGGYVHDGDELATVVPVGNVRVVAAFHPASALGRVRVGQAARVRLEGFPWIEYGTLRATVTGVGSELREGRVRVELAVHADPGSALPLEHGLPATAEVEVERATPAALASRAVGRALARPVAPAPPPLRDGELQARP